MKITNAELMAKIASGQILPGICKNIKVNTNIEDVDNVDDLVKEVDIKLNQNHQNVQRRLYNKYYNFKSASSYDEKVENNKNIMTSYLIKSKEPNITSFVHNDPNDATDKDFANEIQQLQQVIAKKEKEIDEIKNANQSIEFTHVFESTKKYVEQTVPEVVNVVNHDFPHTEKTIPLPIEKLSYESGTDIILKGADIILSINKCGLIGNTTKILPEIAREINTDNIGLMYSNSEFMSSLFSYNNQNLNFNCTKINYKLNSENKCVINSNLYETTDNKQVLQQNNNTTSYESLVPVKNYDVCVDDILSSETIGKSKELTHTISYSFRKHDNKISVNVTLTNTTNQILTDVKYYYAMNLNVSNNKKINNASRFKTSPYETGIFCTDNEYNKRGIYLRTKEVDSNVFIDKEWDWFYNDKWDKIKLPKYFEVEREDLAISGLAFNKPQLKPKASWSINFSIGFAKQSDFNSREFSKKPTGLSFVNSNFSNKLLHNIITTCADFTRCDLSGADLSANSLTGSITGPLAANSQPPAKLPNGYKCVESSGEKYIVGPGVILLDVNLTHIDFTGMNLSNSDLSGSNLSNSLFSKTNLLNVTMSTNSSHDSDSLRVPGYIVCGGTLVGPNLNYINENFSNMDLSNLNLSGCVFTNCNFSLANISRSNLSNCKFEGIVPGPFEKYQVFGTILPSGYQFVNLPDNKMCIAGPKVNFSGFDLSNAHFTNVDLSEANLSNTIITNANFSNCIFTNTITGPVICDKNKLKLPANYKIVSDDFSVNKYIAGPNIMLINRNLSYFNFSHVNLSGAKFMFSDLSKSNLTNTNLENTCLPLVIGPLSEASGKPKNYQKTMSLENFDGTKWLIYRLENYKWDVYSSQLHKAIYKN